MTLIEKKNKKKGMRRSIILHLLLLLIFFFFSFSSEPKERDPDKPPYPVVVDFTFEESSLSTYAHADVGESRPKNEEVEKVETAQPKEVEIEKPVIEIPQPTPVVTTPAPTDPVVSKTTVDDSPVQAQETDMVIDEPVKEKVPEKPKETTKPTKTTGSVKVIKPGTNGTGTDEKLPSKTDGAGKGKGDTGTGSGSDKGDDNTSGKGTGADGTGEYDGSGNGVFGRKVIFRNFSKIPMTKKGIISVKTCINRAGRVTFIELIESETTITERSVLKQAMSAAEGYKFEPDLKAPKEQCGKLIIRLDGDAIPGIRGN